MTGKVSSERGFTSGLHSLVGVIRDGPALVEIPDHGERSQLASRSWAVAIAGYPPGPGMGRSSKHVRTPHRRAFPRHHMIRPGRGRHRAGSDPQPAIRLARKVMLRGSMTMSLAPRPRARLMRWAKVGIGRAWIRAPQQDAAGVLKIRRWGGCAKRVLRPEHDVPRADVNRREPVRTAEGMTEPIHPRLKSQNALPDGVAQANTTEFGTGLRFDLR